MPAKQSRTQCFENTAFRLAYTPDNEFSRRLLLFLVSSCFFVCTQVSIWRVVHSRIRASGLRVMGIQKWERRCTYLVHANHQVRKTWEPREAITVHWEEWTTALKDILPRLPTINLFCFPSAGRSSESNIQFSICQPLNQLHKQLLYLQDKKWLVPISIDDRLKMWSLWSCELGPKSII